MSKLGALKKETRLDWITQRGKADSPEQADIVESPGKPTQPEKKAEKPRKHEIAELHALPDTTESIGGDEKFTLLIKPELAERLYSEAFHDPMRRFMKAVIVEILEEALAKRPNKGPAPPQFIQGLKSRGKRKKS